MKRYIRSDEYRELTEQDIKQILQSHGIDTTLALYELKQTFYERFSGPESKVFKFKCPGDWLAVFGMRVHGDVSPEEINDWGSDYFEELVEENPTVESLLDASLRHEEEYTTIYLKNLSTNTTLYEGEDIIYEELDDAWE